MLEMLALASLTVPLDPPTSARPAAVPDGSRLATIHWADVDRDGLDDAFVLAPDGAALLLRNLADGTFEDVTAQSGLEGLDAPTLAAFADHDNDLWPDLFVATPRGARLFLNRGGAAFVDVTLDSGIAPGERVLHADWLDYDQDGLADLHLRTEACDQLYRNLGAGRFEPVDLHLPEAASRASAHAPDRIDGDPSAEPSPLDANGALGPDHAGTVRTSTRTPGVSVSGSGATLSGTTTGGSQYVGGSSSHTAGPPPLSCSDALVDQATSACGLEASSTPTFGMLYPLGSEFNIDSNGKVGIGITGAAYRLHVETPLAGDRAVYGKATAADGVGLYGVHSAITGSAPGVYGVNASHDPNATGVRGEVLTGVGSATGVRGTTVSTNGTGVRGEALGSAGASFGVYGTSSSPTGLGVFGDHAAASGTSAGVHGRTLSTATGAAAVRGECAATSGTTSGVLGTSSSSDGIGVRGTAPATGAKGEATGTFGKGVWGVNTFVPIIGSALPVGVYGEVAYSGARGVHGVNTSTTGSGNPYGVYGEVSHANGVGVYGQSWSSSGQATGVAGVSMSTGGSGVFGQGGTFSGTNYGVRGQTNSADGYAVYAEGRLRVDANAGIGVSGAPSHRLTVQSTDEETVRLLGPDGGGLQFGARLNFGDGDFVYVEEDVDDHLKILARQGTAVTTDNVAAVPALAVTNNVAFSSSAPALRAENLATGNAIALIAQSWGTNTAALINNRSTGPHIQCSPGGGQIVFEVKNSGRCVTTALQITGGGDLVEGFEAPSDCEPGSVVVIDPANPGDLKLSSEPYDRKVAGVVSGAGGVAHGIQMGQDDVLDGETLVAMTGRVYVRCTSEGGPIAPGDRLTTSSTPGLAMRATDPARCDGAVIGKAMSALEGGTGLVLVLVNLQ